MATANSMEALLASLEGKSLSVNRGDQVTGTVVTVTNSDFVIDLGTKAEAVLPKRDLYGEYENLKVGDKVEAYVVATENESGQTVLSIDRNFGKSSKGPQKNWGKYVSAMNSKKRLHGRVMEANKGGLVVDLEGIRAFLPSSQINVANIKNVNELIGQEIGVRVIEVDPNNNRLIVSERDEPTEDLLAQLAKYEIGQKVTAEVSAVLPFGVIVSVDGLEAIIFGQDVAWEKIENLGELFKVGDSVEALITGIDQAMGRLVLSVKKLQEDPFAKIAEKYQPDDVVKATVTEVNENGVSFSLADGIMGVMDRSKVESGTSYQVGQSVTVLVDSVDARQRRVNLAPMLTTTSGLIYK